MTDTYYISTRSRSGYFEAFKTSKSNCLVIIVHKFLNILAVNDYSSPKSSEVYVLNIVSTFEESVELFKNIFDIRSIDTFSNTLSRWDVLKNS